MAGGMAGRRQSAVRCYKDLYWLRNCYNDLYWFKNSVYKNVSTNRRSCIAYSGICIMFYTPHFGENMRYATERKGVLCLLRIEL